MNSTKWSVSRVYHAQHVEGTHFFLPLLSPDVILCGSLGLKHQLTEFFLFSFVISYEFIFIMKVITVVVCIILMQDWTQLLELALLISHTAHMNELHQFRTNTDRRMFQLWVKKEIVNRRQYKTKEARVNQYLLCIRWAEESVSVPHEIFRACAHVARFKVITFVASKFKLYKSLVPTSVLLYGCEMLTVLADWESDPTFETSRLFGAQDHDWVWSNCQEMETGMVQAYACAVTASPKPSSGHFRWGSTLWSAEEMLDGQC